MSRSPIPLHIPPELDFAALALARDSVTGDITFEWAPLEQICAANALDPSMLEEEDSDIVSELIVAWYEAHLAAGGAPDPIQEGLLLEEDDG